MHRFNQSRQCLICFEDLMKDVSLYHIFYQPTICLACLQSFHVLDRIFKLNGYRIRILYQYNEFFKKLLFQYKGQYDYALKDAFLNPWVNELKKEYQDYIIVIAPSSKDDNEKRGFCPNHFLARNFSNQVFEGLYKVNNYKQTDNNDRSLIKNIIKINNGNMLTNKKVLIFDDVITSSNTIMTCIELVKQQHPKKIEVLVLSSNQINTLFTK